MATDVSTVRLHPVDKPEDLRYGKWGERQTFILFYVFACYLFYVIYVIYAHHM
jgi:hypothetical protein